MVNKNLLDSVVLPGDKEALTLCQTHRVVADDGKELIMILRYKNIFLPDDIGLEVFNMLDKEKMFSISKIHELLDDKYGYDNIDLIIREMLYYRLLCRESAELAENWEGRITTTPKEFLPRNISLNITHKCNLSCKYCYGDGGSFGSPNADMTLEVAKSAVDWQAKNLQITGAKNAEIIFFGGEPLMNFEIIEPIVKYVKSVCKKNNLNISFGMTTNATLLSEEVARKLVELEVFPMVSIDGVYNIQNNQRPFKNGLPSYDATIQGARNYMRIANKRISARATYVETNFVDSVKTLFKEGFKNVFLSSASGSFGKSLLSSEGIDMTIKGFEDLYSYFSEILQNGNGLINLPYSNTLIRVLRSYSIGEKVPWPCGGGRAYVGIGPDGEIYLCHRFVGNKKFSQGNVCSGQLNSNLYEEIITNAGSRKGKCKDCWVRFECAGGCFHHNYVNTGNIFTSHESECDFTKKFVELGIKFFYKFFRDNKSLLEKICKIKDPVEYN